MMARAMMCAVEWRSTSSASRSLGVRMRSSIGPVSVDPFSSGRSRSTTVPLATAATAALASPVPIPATTSRGRVPSGYSLIEPSGSLIWSIVGHISEVVGLPGDRDLHLGSLGLGQINPTKWFLPRIPRPGLSLGPRREPGREVDLIGPATLLHSEEGGPFDIERWTARSTSGASGWDGPASSIGRQWSEVQGEDILKESPRRSSPAQRGPLRPRADTTGAYANFTPCGLQRG